MSFPTATCRDRFRSVAQKLSATVLVVVGSVSVSGQTSLQYDFTNFAGYPAAAAGTNDGLGTTARFSNPTSVALDTNGNIFVADQWNGFIRETTPQGLVSPLR
jgi:hypothetical protein